MFLGDSNLLILSFLFLFSTFLISSSSSLHLLLTAELLWITLYGLSLLIGFTTDNLNIVSLTFFALILSAVEFGVGLVLILFQHTFTRTLDFNIQPLEATKGSYKSSPTLHFNNTFNKV